MVVISRLQPRNSGSMSVGLLCEIQDGEHVHAFMSIQYRGFRITLGTPMNFCRYSEKFRDKLPNKMDAIRSDLSQISNTLTFLTH